MQELFLFIQHHAMLSAALVIVLIFLFIVEFIRQKRGTNQLSPSMATALINHENAVVVDIRTPEAFANGHIIDAVSLPLSDLTDKQKKLEKFKSRPLLIVCATGTDASRAAATLINQGFTVHILAGGIQAWRGADMPLVKG